MEIIIFFIVQQMCEPFICLSPHQIRLNDAKFCDIQVFFCMRSTSGCQYRWSTRVTVWVFQCVCKEHHFVPSMLIDHSTVMIMFANSRIGRDEVGRGREAIAKWPGKMRSAEETGMKGQLSPAKCKCVYCQRGKRLKNNGLVTAIVLKRNVHFPPHFRQVNSQLSHLSYLKYLQDSHISFVQTTLIFCTKSIMQACLESKGATKDFYVREVLCNPRKSVWAIDTFLCFLTTECV